jgi:hypothetical protein
MQPSLWPRLLVTAGLVANAISRNPAAQLSEAARVDASSADHAPHAAHPFINLKGAHGFDFLAGEWRVHHRRISAVSKQWVEFEGTSSHRSLMAGSANVEEFALESPDGAYRALNLRAYDTNADRWSIWWLDERYPEGPLGRPVEGRFENGVGTFYSDYQENGTPMRVRFI